MMIGFENIMENTLKQLTYEIQALEKLKNYHKEVKPQYTVR